jgi:hypothetical protein
MSKTILTNVRVISGAVDLTGVANRLEITPAAEVKDVTNFGSVDANGTLWRENIVGLFSANVAAAGQWEALDASKVDDDAWANFGGAGPWSIFGGVGVPLAEGIPAYMINAVDTSYTIFDAVGEVAPWQAGAVSSGGFARGMLALNPASPRIATGTGAIVNAGAVPAGRNVYAALHVLSVAGTATPTFTATLQSAALVGFGSPTTRATFTAATARGFELKIVPGAITDAFWRISYTISGTTPSFLVASTIGIG